MTFSSTFGRKILPHSPSPRVDCLIISCKFFSQAEEKKRQEEEEMLSKKLHEEQALHEAQLKEVYKNNLRSGEAHLSKIRKYGLLKARFPLFSRVWSSIIPTGNFGGGARAHFSNSG